MMELLRHCTYSTLSKNSFINFFHSSQVGSRFYTIFFSIHQLHDEILLKSENKSKHRSHVLPLFVMFTVVPLEAKLNGILRPESVIT